MAEIYKVQIEDENGNIHYPHTTADVVFMANEKSTEEAIEEKVDASGGDISATKVGSITASTASYPVPAAGDTVKAGVGKVIKFFGDIRNWMTGVCLIGSIVNNCVTNNAGLPLSAAQGKVLMDLFTKLNSDNTLRNVTDDNFEKSDIITYVLAYKFGSLVLVTFTVRSGLSGWVETTLTSTITPIADVTCTRGRSAGVADNNLNIQGTLKADGKIYFHFESATAYAQSFSVAYFTTK